MTKEYIPTNDCLKAQRKIFREECEKLKELEKQLETETNNAFNNMLKYLPNSNEDRYRALSSYTTKINTRNLVQENIEYLEHILRNLEYAIETGQCHYIGSVRPFHND